MSTTTSLGQKHCCGECSVKFYDMNKAQATCPKCATVVPIAAPIRIVRHASSIAKPMKAANNHSKANASADDTVGFKSGEIDTIDALEEDDDVLVSLSELEDRENNDRPETDDDVHEEDLMEEMKNYDTILDKPEEETDGEGVT
jgi:uncharacterized protein (TIGR02300 family)